MLALLTALKSRVVQYLAVALAALGVAFSIFWAGRRSQQATQARDTLKSLKRKAKSDAEVGRMGNAARRAWLKRWVRDK